MNNPSFELPYEQWSGTVRVANGWVPFWSTGDPPEETSQGPCEKPEFKELSRSLDERRVVDGDTAQCWFIRWKVMDGGVFQVVDAVAGRDFSFDVSVQAWCSNSSNPAVSDGEMYIRLGIDPNGGADPFSADVVWSNWDWAASSHTRRNSPTVLAKGGQITLFIRAWNKWRLSHNDIYVDNAHLIGSSSPPGGGDVDYDLIRQIVREELQQREPVQWPRQSEQLTLAGV